MSYNDIRSGVTNKIRNTDRQQVRRAIVAATNPLRGPFDWVAQPQVTSTKENRPIYGIREVGAYKPTPAAHGEMMATRPYDQSSVVLSIGNGEATFRNLHALDGKRRVLYEQQLAFGTLGVSLERLEPVSETYDNVVYLSNTEPSNFYHWLIYTLPMLRLYHAASVEIDKVYVGQELSSWQLRTLDFVGLSADQVLTKPCRAENAHVAVSTRHVTGVPPDQILWARSAFVPNEPPAGNRRLFVGRGSNTRTRSMIDEEVIASALEREFDFEYITTSGMTFDEEIELFRQTEAIVGPFGAALTNMLFSPRGTKILELQAFDNDFSTTNCYQEIGAVLGNPHGMIQGVPTETSGQGPFSNINVPRDTVLREVEKMLSASA